MSLPRETVLQDARQGLMDCVDCLDYYLDAIQEPFNYAAFSNYWQLLGACEDTEALPIMLDALRLTHNDIETYVRDFSIELLLPSLVMLGRHRVDLLEAYLYEGYNASYLRNYASEAISHIGYHFPERREEMGATLLRILQFHLDNLQRDDLIDSVFLSFHIRNICNLKYQAARPAIEQAFSLGLIDEMVYEDLEEILNHLNDENDRLLYAMHKNAAGHFTTAKYIDLPKSPEEEAILEAFHNPPPPDPIQELKDEVRADMFAKLFSSPTKESYAEPKPQYKKVAVRTEKKIGRNDPCPCGSGKKYKKCCWGK